MRLLRILTWLTMAAVVPVRAQDGWHQVATVPDNPRSMWFVTPMLGWYGGDANGSGTIRRTTDGGLSWVPMPWPDPPAFPNSIRFLNTQVGFVACRNGEIRKTTNGGAAWRTTFSFPSGELRGMTFYDEQRGWVTVQNGVLRTTDGGETWTQSDIPGSASLSDVSFGTPQAGIAVGVGFAGYAFKSTDGGVSWFSLSFPRAESYGAVRFLAPATAVVTGVPGIIRTTNAGITWSTVSGGLPSANRLAFADARNGWATGGARIRRTTNGGESWTEQPWAGSAALNGVACVDSLHAWAYAAGAVFRTVNGGHPTGPPPAPVLRSPVNGAANLSLPFWLVWDSLTASDSYRVQVSADSVFNAPAINESLLTRPTTLASSLSDGTGYFWRAAARNSFGYGSWSAVWRFSTRALNYVPVLFNPVNGSRVVPIDVPFSWSAEGSASYRLQISTDSLFACVVYDDSAITGGYRSVARLEDSTVYYWHVRNKTSDGRTFWSEVRSFVTLSPNTGLFPFSVGNTWYYRSYSLTVPNLVGAVKRIVSAPPGGWVRVDVRTTYRNAPDTIGTEYWLGRYGRLYRSNDTMVIGQPGYDATILRDTSWGGGPWSVAYHLFILPLFGATYNAQAMTERFVGHVGGSLDYTAAAPGLGFYQLESRSIFGTTVTSRDTSILVAMLKDGTYYGDSTAVGVEEHVREGLPERVALHANYPNPFNPATTIRFDLPGASTVRLAVYDLLGREVALLVDEHLSAGSHEVRFDATNLASGVYTCRLTAGSTVLTRRMMLVR